MGYKLQRQLKVIVIVVEIQWIVFTNLQTIVVNKYRAQALFCSH